jgi:DNA-binding NtrC family response regulator
MTLRAFIVADPVLSTAELVQSQCQRLAAQALVATHGDQLLALAAAHRPEIVIYSLELAQPPLAEAIPKLLKVLPDSLIMASYRELSVGHMNKMERFGVKEFLPHPVDPTEIFRAVSRRFGLPVRQHPRFAVAVPVHRADGALLGTSRNLSLGGLSYVSQTAQRAGESLLLHLSFGAAPAAVVRFRVLGSNAEASGTHVIRGQFENLRGPGLQQLVNFLALQGTPP